MSVAVLMKQSYVAVLLYSRLSSLTVRLSFTVSCFGIKFIG